MTSEEDLAKLLENLPFFIKQHVNNHIYKDKIIEIIIDLGRRPEARFITGPEYLSQGKFYGLIYSCLFQFSCLDQSTYDYARSHYTLKLSRSCYQLHCDVS